MAIDLSMPVLIVDDYATLIFDGSGALTKLRSHKYGLR